jgi:hypothetical protein
MNNLGQDVSLRSIRRAAVNAEVDERTVRKILRGEHVRGVAGERARAALRAMGIEPPAQGKEPRT